MVKKNYLTRGEQEIWEYIQNKGIIDNELVKDIFPEMPQNKRNKLLHSLCKKGYIKRTRKDTYITGNLNSFHELALKIRPGYIGLSSALRDYNLLDYEDFTIFVMTKDFQKKMRLKGTKYSLEFVPLGSLFTGYEKNENIIISSIEKTLFDCFLKPQLVGFTNITKALYDAKIDWEKFISFFKMTKNNSLCQRTGYMLEMMKKTKLKVPSFVFEFLQSKVKNPVKLVPSRAKSTFNKKWKIQDSLGEKHILSWWYQ